MSQDSNERPFLPFALPSIGEEEIAAVIDTIRSGWLTTGPKTAAFENSFGEVVGARHALAVNSATAGLHLALEAIGVDRDDQGYRTLCYLCRGDFGLVIEGFWGTRAYFRNRGIGFLARVVDLLLPPRDPIGWTVVLSKTLRP